MASHRVGDVRIEIEERGDGAAPAFLLIRGLGTQLVQWPDALLDGLAKEGFRVLVFDNRDVGLSEKLEASGAPDLRAVVAGAAEPPYRLADMARDAVGVLDALAIERAHVVGISMGGMVAQHVAASHGERCRSMTSIMSSSGASGLPPASPEAMAALTSQPESDDRESVIAHGMRSQRVFESPAFALDDAELRDYCASAYDRCHYPLGIARHMAAVIADGSRADMLKTISVPTLVVHGADDPLVHPACGEDTARHVPGARLETIPGMGHDVTPTNAPILVRLLVQHAREAAEA